MAARWTIRVPDDVARVHKVLSASLGVSTQALVEAAIRAQVEWFEEQEGRPIEEWEGEPAVLARWDAAITKARQIDAKRRSRG